MHAHTCTQTHRHTHTKREAGASNWQIGHNISKILLKNMLDYRHFPHMEMSPCNPFIYIITMP